MRQKERETQTERETERDAGQTVMTVAYNNNINESNNIIVIVLATVVQYVESIY